MGDLVSNVAESTVVGFVGSPDYASSMLSQSLMAPVLRELLTAVDTKSISTAVETVFSDRTEIASTSELLSGFYYEDEKAGDTISTVITTVDKNLGDPLAFAVGLSDQRDAESPDPILKKLHKKYNETARKLFETKKVPVFGLRTGLTDGGYTGGLDEPSVVAGLITNWWFLQPTHQEAQRLFLAVKEYINEGISGKVKKNFTQEGAEKTNDLRILEQAAEDMIRAKTSTGLWGGQADSVLADWGLIPVGAAQRTRDAVTDALDLSVRNKEAVEEILKDEGRNVARNGINKFYNDAGEAGSIESAIRSARWLLRGLINLDKMNKKNEGEGVIKGKQISKLYNEKKELDGVVERLKTQISEMGLNPVERKFEMPRLGRDSAALIFQHSHPEILDKVFSKETVDHFNTIASSVYIHDDDDDKLLVVSSSSEEGDVNQWLL